MDDKAPDAFRTISEVADELDLPQHVLRFWESRFREIKPMKRGGGRRYYRPDDIDLLRGIRHLLYGEGYTIRGVQRILKEQGVKFVQSVWEEGAPQPPHGVAEEEEFTEETESASDGLEEETGLRSRISSFIGRDLGGGRQADAGERRDPPMQSAPMPRIAPEDRVMHGGAEPAPSVYVPPPEPMPPPVVMQASQPAPAPEPARVSAPAPQATAATDRLMRDDRHKLHAVLRELLECRKLIDAVVARQDAD